jgi:putative Mg2+ transporter-C (MgtC) family protein
MSGELSHRLGDSGPTRIASNIVQGKGFLGAGAILKESGGLVGMTTAATIFVEAAIGMAAGGGFYLIATSTTAIVIFALVVLAWGAERLNLRARMLLFRFTTNQAENVATEVQQLLAAMKIRPVHFRTSMAGTTSTVEFEADVNHREQMEIVSKMNRGGVVTEVVPWQGLHE